MSTGKIMALLQAAAKGGTPLVVTARVTDAGSGSCSMNKWAPAIYSAYETGRPVVCDVYDVEQQYQGRLQLLSASAEDTNGNGKADRFQVVFSAIDGTLAKQITCLSTGADNGNSTAHTAMYSTRSLVLPETFAWNSITGKPFHALPGAGAVVVADVPFDNSSGQEQFPITTPFGLEKGREYIVTINGTDYLSECISFTESGMTIYALGNTPMMMGGESNGLPFVIVSAPDGMEDEDGNLIYGMFLVLPMDVPIDSGSYRISQASNDPVMLNADSLPAMTATTKGGAIAGEGLVMDGDVLKVDMDAIIAQVKAALNG